MLTGLGQRRNLTVVARRLTVEDSVAMHPAMGGGDWHEPIFQDDADGNLTNDGRWVYTWDAENRLILMETLASMPAGVKQKLLFSYDAQGRRISKVVSNWTGSVWVNASDHRFVYDGWNLIAILAPDSSLQSSFTWGLDLSGSLQGAGGVGGLLFVTSHSSPVTSHFVCYDGNGNVTALLKADGSELTAQYEYGPFGEPIRATGPMAEANPFRFSTKYQDDETDSYYYGYRHYNPSLGRWLSRDPIGERGGLNVFSFCGNRPVNSYDKFGLTRARFERTTNRGNLECHEICVCEPTEFYMPPDLNPVPVQPGQPIDLKNWVYFQLFYPEWTGEGCTCVYYGWKGDEFLKNKRQLTIALALTGVLSALAAGKTLNIRDFGTIADGMTKDTTAITKAIASLADAGGVVVHFPAGKYLTGAIHLKSGVTLDLDAGATLLFSTDPADYPLVRTRWESTDCYNFSPLIYASGAEHIAITGRGKLDGQGKAWHPWKDGPAVQTIERLREMGERNVPVEQRRFGTVADGLRPQMIQFFRCRDVRVEGVTITGAPFWSVHPVYSTNVVIRGVTFDTTGPNTDGIDPESCRNVLIEQCRFNTGDDCIAIKSGRDADGRRVGIPCENITVRDCEMGHGHGGVSIGSEMSGGVRHVRVSNCVMNGTDRAIRIKTMRGRGGVVEDVVVSGIKGANLQREPVEITMHYKKTPAEPLSERTPALRNIHISGLVCVGATAAFSILGLPERAVEDVTFSDMKITAQKGGVCESAKHVRFDKVSITTEGAPMTFENCTDIQVNGRKQ